ncbi:MAG: MFS transporter [Chloroflexi bacterium]|nr:MFS transporter [Chloroflexota bacterium]
MAKVNSRDRYSRMFFLAMLAQFVFFASIHLLMWTLPLYISLKFPSATEVGLIIGLMAVSAVLLRPWAGAWADRYGRKVLLVAGAVATGIAPLFYLAGGSLPLLAVGRLIQGAGICLFTTGYGALIPDITQPSRRGEAIGLASITMPLSLMIMPRVGAAVQEHYGFAVLFVASCVVAAMALSVSLVLPRGNYSGQSGVRPVSFRSVLGIRRLWAALAAVAALALAWGALLAFLPLFAESRGIAGGSYFFLGYGLAQVAASYSVGGLSDRYGRARLIVPGMLGVAVALVLVSRVSSLVPLLVLAPVIGLLFGAAKISLDAFCVDSVPVEGRGAVVSLEFAVFDAGIGLGSLGLGAVADALGYGNMFVAMSGLVLAGLLTFVFLHRRNGRAA